MRWSRWSTAAPSLVVRSSVRCSLTSIAPSFKTCEGTLDDPGAVASGRRFFDSGFATPARGIGWPTTSTGCFGGYERR